MAYETAKEGKPLIGNDWNFSRQLWRAESVPVMDHQVSIAELREKTSDAVDGDLLVRGFYKSNHKGSLACH